MSKNSSKKTSIENCLNCPIANLCPIWTNAQIGSSPTLSYAEEESSYVKGQEIFQTGAEIRYLHIIISGSVKQYSINKQGDEQITSFHGIGEIIGLGGLASGTHVSYAQALEPTILCNINIERSSKVVITRELKLSQILQKILSAELFAREEHIMVIAKFTAEQRVVNLLLKLSDRLIAIHSASNELRLPMTRYEIANYLALTVETVSRIFTSLQQKNIIKVNGRYVLILEREALKGLLTTGNIKHSS